MMCFVVRYKGDWVQASHYAGVLLDESLWSKVNHSIVNIAFQQLGFDNHYNKTSRFYRGGHFSKDLSVFFLSSLDLDCLHAPECIVYIYGQTC